jgi:ATP adenylyltransferase
MEYLSNENNEGCIFCLPRATDGDRDRLVLHRTPCSLVMLNRYPYTNGHLLIAPRRHTAEMNDLSDAEMLDLFATVRICRDILQATARPDGYNIGMNLGHAAGAGVEDHLHLHIVPRWTGDTNFMSVIPDVRVMPETLLTTYDRLLPVLLARLGGADR